MQFTFREIKILKTLGHGWSGLCKSCVLFGLIGAYSQEPQCTILTDPSDGATDIAVTSEIHWAPVPNATHYLLVMGDSPGGTNIADSLNLGSDNSFRPPSGLDPNRTYYVTIIPGNNDGDALGCTEAHFTTGAGGGAPGCITLQYPENGSYAVPPDATIRWFPQSGAVGYLLAVGTGAATMDLLAETDLGNVTSYSLPADLPYSQQIYVRITPYNAAGEQPVCTVQSFRTRGDFKPLCTETINPRDGDQFVSVTANITWIREFNAAGYRMTIEEKTPGGLRILDNEDVGNGTNFKPPNFKGNTKYFVTIVPYNDLGAPMSCNAISFTTAAAPEPPDCTNLLLPAPGASNVAVNTDLQWAATDGARGYILSVATSPGSGDLLNRVDVGNTTTYGFPTALPAGVRIYVSILPYSNWGEAENCRPQSFATAAPVFTPKMAGIPKFFTPNNDGYNDTWVIRSMPEIRIDKVFIFNRYGKLLMQLDVDQPWDGSFSGKPVASDTYWYKVATAEGRIITGFFLLKR